MNFLRKLRPLQSPKTPTRDFRDLPWPHRPLIVVGDIHGRMDLLDVLLAKFGPEILVEETKPDLVFVGDYVDRGDKSLEVLIRLRTLTESHGSEVTCLMGNHERMMLDFLDDPTMHGKRWLRNGGLQTLASFGVGYVTEFSEGPALITAQNELSKAIPKGMEKWLRSLPMHFESGNVNVVHAGANPCLPMDRQDPHSLLWGHKDFLTTERDDGRRVVFGHTITEVPFAKFGRISVDTGAVFKDRLTAACIFEGVVRFTGTL